MRVRIKQKAVSLVAPDLCEMTANCWTVSLFNRPHKLWRKDAKIGFIVYPRTSLNQSYSRSPSCCEWDRSRSRAMTRRRWRRRKRRSKEAQYVCEIPYSYWFKMRLTRTMAMKARYRNSYTRNFPRSLLKLLYSCNLLSKPRKVNHNPRTQDSRKTLRLMTTLFNFAWAWAKSVAMAGPYPLYGTNRSKNQIVYITRLLSGRASLII